MGGKRTRKTYTSSNNKRLLVRSEEIHHVLPREIMSEILVRVPAQFLIEFKIVCKFWRNLISDPNFVNAHLSHHRCNSQQAIVISKLSQKWCIYFSNDLGDTGKRLDRCRLHLPDCTKGKTCSLHDSCNGLLLLQTWVDGKQFYVCNPITRRYTKFSSPFGQYSSNYWALACDASTHKYKVIGFGFYECLTFTLGERAPRINWRKIPTPHKKYYLLRESISAYNELHWLVWDRSLELKLGNPSPPSELYIYSLDVTKEELRKTQVKPYKGNSKRFDYHLLELNGSLCIANVVSENQLDIWTLVDSINCTWNKNHSIHFEIPLCRVARVYGYPSSNSCQKRIFVDQRTKLSVIDLKSEKLSLVYDLKGTGGLETALCYPFHTNSLVNWK